MSIEVQTTEEKEKFDSELSLAIDQCIVEMERSRGLVWVYWRLRFNLLCQRIPA